MFYTSTAIFTTRRFLRFSTGILITDVQMNVRNTFSIHDHIISTTRTTSEHAVFPRFAPRILDLWSEAMTPLGVPLAPDWPGPQKMHFLSKTVQENTCCSYGFGAKSHNQRGTLGARLARAAEMHCRSKTMQKTRAAAMVLG